MWPFLLNSVDFLLTVFKKNTLKNLYKICKELDLIRLSSNPMFFVYSQQKCYLGLWGLILLNQPLILSSYSSGVSNSRPAGRILTVEFVWAARIKFQYIIGEIEHLCGT